MNDTFPRALGESHRVIAKWLDRYTRILPDVPKGDLIRHANDPVSRAVFADHLRRMKCRTLGRLARRRAGLTPLERLAVSKSLPEGVRAELVKTDADAAITRGLACACVVHEFKFDREVPLMPPFTDLGRAEPFYSEVAALRHRGIVIGYHETGRFNPHDPLTYFGLAKILAGAFLAAKADRAAPAQALISYSRDDEDIAVKLQSHLERRAVKVWFDLEKLLPGMPLREAISKAVADPDVVVIALVSASSAASLFTRIEWNVALADPKAQEKVLVLRLDQTQVPAILSPVLYTQLARDTHNALVDEANFETVVEELVSPFLERQMSRV